MALRALFPSFAFEAWERGGGGGLKLESHLMEENPQTSNLSPLFPLVSRFTHNQKSE